MKPAIGQVWKDNRQGDHRHLLIYGFDHLKRAKVLTIRNDDHPETVGQKRNISLHRLNGERDGYSLVPQGDSLDALTHRIREWAMERDIHKVNARDQVLCTLEELGELAAATRKLKPDREQKDAVGDIFVTLVTFCTAKGWDLRDCVTQAYNEIRDRKGRMLNGTFVKEADLSFVRSENSAASERPYRVGTVEGHE